MPVENGIGYGPSTPWKHEQMSRYGKLHQVIADPVLRKHAAWMGGGVYHLVDMTAGDGHECGHSCPKWSYDVQLVFAAHARFGTKIRADMIECVPENAASLRSAVNSVSNVAVHCADHRDVLPSLVLPAKACGLLVYDPNPQKDNIDSAFAIGRFMARYEKMDVLTFLASTTFKRIKDERAPTWKDVIDHMGKAHWLIGPPNYKAANRYVVALGTNWPKFPDWQRVGFVNLKTEEGQQRLEMLTLTGDEMKERQKKKQLSLLPTAPTRNTYGIPSFALFDSESSNEPEASASGAGGGR